MAYASCGTASKALFDNTCMGTDKETMWTNKDIAIELGEES